MDPTTWQAPWGVVVLALFVIVMARANGTYWLGRGITKGAASRWRSLLDSRAYRTGARLLNRWGPPAVTVCFLTIGVQTMVNLAAGITRMPLRRYLPAVALGCVLWAFMYGTVGFVGFLALQRLWTAEPVITLLLGLAGVALLGAWLLRRSPKPA